MSDGAKAGWPEGLTRITAEQVAAHYVRVRPEDWSERLPPAAVPTWLTGLPEDEHRAGYRRLSRADLVAHADVDDAQELVQLMTAVYAWGKGDGRQPFARYTRWLTTSDVSTVGSRLRTALDVLTAEGARAAYLAMRPGGTARVRYLGPSFFTKYLHFLAYAHGVPDPQPLILDQFVAVALGRLRVVEGLSRRGPWTSGQYLEYLEWAHTIATDLDGAAALEMSLFQHGRTEVPVGEDVDDPTEPDEEPPPA